MKKFTLVFFMLLFSICGYSQLALEDFEDTPWGANGPTGWGIYQNSVATSIKWRQSNPLNASIEPPYEGDYCAFLNNQNAAPGSLPQDWFTTPAFNLPANPKLQFYSRLGFNGDQGSIYKILIMPAASDPALLSSYTEVVVWTETQLNGNTQDDYIQKIVTTGFPAELVGQQVRIAFYMEGVSADRWLIDNVSVGSACFIPVLEATTAITHETASLNWENPNNYTDWEIELIPAAQAFDGTGVPYTGQPPYLATDMDPETEYKYRVRAVCGIDNYSEWSLAGNFATLPVPPANDLCTNATVLTVSATDICAASTPGTVQGATGTPDGTCTGTEDDDVWYEFVATNTSHIITLTNVTGNSTDMAFSVLAGTDCAALTSVLCSDPNTGTATGLTVGQTYKIRVYTFTDSPQRTTTFNICVTTPLVSQPNDDCADATVVPVNADLSCAQTVTGSVINATASAEANTCNTDRDDDDVWYEFVATAPIHTINLTNVVGTTLDLFHVVYSGNDCGNLTQLYCSDPDSSIASGLTIGQTYKIRVYTWSTTAQITTFNVCVGTPPPPPANDACADAITVPVNTDLNCTQVIPGTIAWATPSGEAGATCSGTPDDDVWFEFTATAVSHTINFNDITGSTTNLDHAVYSGACGTLTELYCSPDNSSIAGGLTIGQTYKVRVYSNTATAGQTSTFNVCVGTPPPPPVNDECVNAITVPVNPTLDCTTVVPGTVAWATHSIQGNTCNTGRDDDDVWFEFVATSATHTINFNNVAGSATDIYHVLYSGDDCGNLTQLYCSDPNSSLAGGLTIGEIYKIRVYTWSTTAGQTTTFDVCVGTPPPPPANDECADAVIVPVNPTLECTTVVPGTVEWATHSSQGNTCNTGRDDDDVWFEFTATGPIHTITFSNVTGSATDIYHVLYSGDDCDGLTQLYCSDPNSSIATGLVEGETYKIRVYTWSTTGGQTTTFNVCVGTPPPPPANDDCADAITVLTNPDLNCTNVTPGNIVWATPSVEDIGTCTGSADDDVWFEFVATNTSHTINFNNIEGSTTNLDHAVYEGEDCGTLTLVYCNTNNASVATGLTVGNTYKIRVYSNTGTAGQTTTFDVCVGTPPPPPANDECANAIMAPVNPDHLCGQTVEGTTSWSTASANGSTCTGTEDDDVWFSFVATNETHLIGLLNVEGSVTDMVHSLYTGACGTLTEEYCSDNNNSTAEDLVIGQTYYVRVYTYTSTQFQTVTFDLCIGTPPPPPVNDDCANAIVAPVNNNSLCEVTTLGTVYSATPSTQDIGTCTGTADDDVWFEFTAESTEHYISLLNQAGNRLSTDALNFALYTGDCDALTLVECSEPNNMIFDDLTVGETYKIRVYSSAATSQTYIFQLCIGIVLTCDDASAFCANNELAGVSFPGSLGVPDLGAVSCLSTTPNPTFYFLQIETSGDLSMNISQTSFDGSPIDVDFIAYGPFTDLEDGCANLTSANEVDCSYSASAVEPFSITGAIAGEYYVVMITNYNGTKGTINFTQPNFGDPGAGTTDCTIVCTEDLGEDQVLCGINEFELESNIINADSYQWFLDGVAIDGATGSTYTAIESGTYSIQVTSSSCENNPTDEVVITFLEAIDLPVINDVALCGEGGTSTIDLTTLDGTVLGDLDPTEYTVTYYLTEADAIAGTNPIDTATAFSTTTQTIYVRVEHNALVTCFDVAPINIVVNEEAEASIAYAGPFCSDAADAIVTLTGNIGGVYTSTTGLVINPATGTINIAGSEAGIYTITYTIAATETCDEFVTTTEVTIVELPAPTIAYTDSPYCLSGDSAEVTLTGEEGGVYSSGTGLVIDPATGAIDLTASTAGTYTVTYTIAANAPCAEVITTTEVTINEQPTATIAYDGPYCTSEGLAQVTHTGETGGVYSSTTGLIIDAVTGDIDLTASTGGSYTVTYTIAASNSCPEVEFTATVDITEKPEADFTYASDELCQNAGVVEPSFINNAEAGLFTVDIAGLTIDAATGAITTATSTPGTYVVTNEVDPDGPCTGDTETFTVTILAAPIATFVYPEDAYCHIDTVVPAPVLDGVAGIFTATPAGLAINPATGEIDLAASTPGTYIVSNTVNGTADCPEVSETAEVVITAAPKVFIAEDCNGNNYTLSAVFNDDVYNENDVAFSWTNDAGTVLGTDAELVVDEPAMYYLTVSPVNSLVDCPVTVEANVLSTGCLIPRGISPNGDTLNDNFDLSAFNVTKLSIFNRYGREVYSKTEYTDEWHGQTDGGEDLPTGTYYYMVERANGESKTGWVYINRQEN